jgi:hypothetical protein
MEEPPLSPAGRLAKTTSASSGFRQKNVKNQRICAQFFWPLPISRPAAHVIHARDPRGPEGCFAQMVPVPFS